MPDKQKLDALCDLLLQLGEWPGFVEDLRGSSSPERRYPAVFDAWGDRDDVNELLSALGWRP